MTRQIKVEFEGHKIDLEFDADKPIGQLKELLHKRTGLPVPEIKIYYSGPNREFDDDKTLRHYGLQFGAFFHMSDRKKDPPPTKPRRVSTPHLDHADLDYQKERLQQQQRRSTTILSRISVEEILEDEEKKQQEEAKHDAELARQQIAAKKAAKKWRSKASRKSVSLPVRSSEESKTAVEKTPSKETTTAAATTIKKGEKELPALIDISIQTPSGTSIPMQVHPTDTTETIQERIAQQTEIPLSNQYLTTTSGEELPANKTVQDLGLKQGSQLCVAPRQVPVTVRMANCKETQLLVDPRKDTIAHLKQQLQAESGWSPNNQKLSLKDTELTDSAALAGDCGIQAGSVLDLEPKSITVTVKTPSGKAVQIQVNPAEDSVKNLQQKVAKEAGIAVPHQDLRFNGQSMDSSKTLQEMGLEDGSELQLGILKMPVTVRTKECKEIQLLVDPTKDTISDLKQQLEGQTGIPAGKQKLSMNGRDFNHGKKLAVDCGIQAGSFLDLEPKSITVAVKLPSGKSVDVEVQPSDTTSTIKDKVAKESGVPVSQHILCGKNGEELSNSKTVAELGLVDGSQLSLNALKALVIVRTNDGKEIKLEVDPTADTIGDLKQLLETKTGIDVANQLLSLNGIALVDPSITAADCQIQEGTVLDLEPKAINVSVKTQDGKTFSVQVSSSDTSETIQEKIAEQTGIPVSQQRVHDAAGALLQKGKTAKQLGLQDGSELSVDTLEFPVTVRTADGKEFQVLVDPSKKTINDMKQQLESLSGIPVSNQKLSMNGKEFGIAKQLAGACGIQPGSVLDLEPKCMTVFVKTPTGEEIPIKVEPSFTSRSIKERLVREAGIPITQQVLEFNGKKFPNFKTVKDMGLKDGSELSVDVLKVPVTVRTHDGKEIQLMVNPTDDTIAELKQQLESETGIAAGNQNLSMLGSVLDDPDKTAGDCGILSGSVLDLKPKALEIAIKALDGKTISIEVQPSDTIEAIKEQISEKVGISSLEQILKLSGTVVQNSKTVEGCGIQSGCILDLEAKPISVVVRAPDGKTVRIDVSPEDTTEKIKALVAQDVGIDVPQQVLSFNGKELSNNATIQAMGAKADSVLLLERAMVPITINVPDGKQVNVLLNSSDTIENLKASLAAESGIPPEEQKLCFEGSELSDPTKTIEESNIKPGSFLQLERKRLEATAESQKNRLEEQKQRAEESNRRQSSRKENKEPKAELSEEKQRKCYMWYARMGQPDRDSMIRKVRKLDKSCDITVEDVEALPWMYGGAMLPVKEMNELFMNG